MLKGRRHQLTRRRFLGVMLLLAIMGAAGLGIYGRSLHRQVHG